MRTKVEASSSSTAGTTPLHRIFVRTLPVFLALLAIGIIYTVISIRLLPGPPGLILALMCALIVLSIVAIRARRFRLRRWVGFAILGIITVAEALSTIALVIDLITGSRRLSDVPHDTAIILLRDGALIWLANILTFSLWYWELDGGGPSRRFRDGYHSEDFVFPQLTLDKSATANWHPHYVDYLFLAFNTSTAFSPTDTLVLSHRAKLLMMTQALISLAVLAILAARAINTL